MTTALRPLNTGELLDRTFSIYRNNFVLFAGIAILVPALQLILNVARASAGMIPRGLSTREDTINYFLGIGIALVIGIVGGVLASAATVYAVSMVHLGKTTTITDSYRSISRYFGRLLLLVVLISLVFLGISLLVVVPVVLAVATPDTASLFGILAVIGGLAAIVLVVHFYARLSLSMASCVVEQVSATEAIRRSSFLSKGATGRIWLILILAGVINLALSFAVTVPLTALAVSTHMSLFMTVVLLSCGQLIATTLAAPIATISLVLVYYDQRVRKEAFDLQLMMESLGQALPGQAASASPIG